MASYKNYLIAFLTLTTFGFAGLAWWQAGLITKHPDMATAADRADLRKRVWDAEKRVQSLESQLASAREAKPAGAATPTAPAPADAANRRGPGAFRGMMENPEYQKLMTIQQKAMLDANYAALFKKLKLSPQQLEQFKQLLVERQTSMIDLMSVARAQGLDPRTDPDGYRQLVESTQAEVDQSIKNALGESAYAEYKNYETSAASRNVVTQLDQRLSYNGSPLNESQSAQLLQILNTSNQLRTAAASVAVPAGAGNVINLAVAGSPLVTDEVVAQASGVLAADQVAALQEIQQEQEAAAQMRRMVQEQMGQGNRQPGPNSFTMPAFQLPNR